MSYEQLSDVANKLVRYCRTHDETECLDRLYAQDAVSVEAMAMAGSENAETAGLDRIREKHAWWTNAMEVHSSTVDGPYLHGHDRFGVIFEFNATNRQTGERMEMKELAIYTVTKGKIVREEFFYTI